MFWRKDVYETVNIETVLYVQDDEIAWVQPFIEDNLQLSGEKSIIKLRNTEEYIVNHNYLELTESKKSFKIRGFYNGNQDMGGS